MEVPAGAAVNFFAEAMMSRT
ncbi:hypothetical protein SMALA_8646 (plasmid) [Streptomyces malaysiensis subsp. malaysiensis]|nr:hypothetical protein SMALA_8646 [Streptomyces malaysiensis]